MLWVNFVLIIVIVLVVAKIVKVSLRKLLKIEKSKKKFFSYNHINKLHVKIDWSFRIIAALTSITLAILIGNQNISMTAIVVVLVVFILADYSIRAFFEWKFSDNPKESILTVSEMFILVVSVVIVSTMNLLNINLH
ncbi:hypothetical protein AB685_17795 [Bacillus sp. LL01]|uniref:DUF4181 domain-containing protein n=1 Tax=Bacillus sp. LL01 TaxID=1665556 RepID=UPI00064CFF11|nr:DUF4181 domain-containing protein [Bacillus sp. LL01]KMJ57253.1 hypothetical protein AB685_17795 [Bacillus sp. LL01]